MADYSAQYGAQHVMSAPGGGAEFRRLTTYAGGVLSLALIIGAGVWGTKLVLRDVSGLPVVQATSGPMRVAASDPGGQIAEHTGLSVNAVAGQGAAAPAEASVTLAPADADIPDEDLTPAPPAQTQLPPGVVEASASSTASTAAPMALLGEDELQGMVDQILADVSAAPLSQASSPAQSPAAEQTTSDAEMVTIMVNGQPVQTRRDISPLAVSQAVRPPLRPSSLRAAQPATQPAAQPEVTRSATTPALGASIPPGTPLVQLGALPSEAVTATEWARISGLYPALMGDLTPVVQRAESGGRVFYRLRARGFADINAAKRFCSALDAQGTECVPVLSQ